VLIVALSPKFFRVVQRCGVRLGTDNKSKCILAALTLHAICFPQREEARDTEVIRHVVVAPFRAVIGKVLVSAYMALHPGSLRQSPRSRCIQHHLDLDHAAKICNGLHLHGSLRANTNDILTTLHTCWGWMSNGPSASLSIRSKHFLKKVRGS
jgi:hypothetical protein